MGIPCFLIEPVSDLYEYSLRRYTHSDAKKCPNSTWGHEASTGCLWKGPASDAKELCTIRGYENQPTNGDNWPHDDPRWPATCKCGYVFEIPDNWQFRAEKIYVRQDTKVQLTIHDAPVGAMWFADWMRDWYKGPDGRCLVVRLPGNHDWSPEYRASNCDSPCKHCSKPYHQHVNEKGQMSGRCQPTWVYNDGNPYYEDSHQHKCWVRHGTPPNEVVHVDKNGVTCGAGAGSIAIPNWHGFLHNGELVG